jgi:PEGA domain
MFMKYEKKVITRSVITPIIIGVISTFFSCSGGKYVIKSEPSDVNVYLNDKLVGKTPLNIPMKDLPEEGNLQFNFVKENYGEIKTIVPGPRIATLGEDIVVRIPKQENTTELINRRMAEILHAHDLAIHNHISESLESIDRIISEDPKLVSAQLLKATVMFLGKNYSGAEDQYEKVLEMDPSSKEATQMIRYLRERR